MRLAQLLRLGVFSVQAAIMQIGNAVIGATNNRALYVDGSGALANSDSFTFDGTTLGFPDAGFVFASDTDTGISRSAANQIGFTAGGTLIARFQKFDTSYPALVLNSVSSISRISFHGQTPNSHEIVYRGDVGSGVWVFYGNGAAANVGNSRMLASSGSNGAFTNGANTSICAGGSNSADGTLGILIDTNGNVSIGSGALATNATNGFFYIPTSAGTPTGTPTSVTGRVPLHYDSTNNKLYVYDGGWLATAALT